MKLLGTGLSGMVGSYVMENLKDSYEFQNLSLETGVDITKPELVDAYMATSDAPWVLHFAAMTDVDAAEKEKELGEKSSTWIVNVGATENIVASSKKYKKRMVYISTDFVFPGGEKVFSEEDTPNPVGWYATTKYEGEKRVAELGDQGVIVRITFPYGVTKGPKQDFVTKMRNQLAAKNPLLAPIDQVFVPTFVEDIAKGIDLIVKNNASGIYHIVGPGWMSSYDAALEVAAVFGGDPSLIQKTTAAEFYQGRALRAFQLRTGNAKIQKLGLNSTSFIEGLTKLKEGAV